MRVHLFHFSVHNAQNNIEITIIWINLKHFVCRLRCCCGQDRMTHPVVPGIEIGILGDVWHSQKHTRAHPTDAYGTIEFQGSAHPTKAQVHEHWHNKFKTNWKFCFIFFLHKIYVLLDWTQITITSQYVRLSYDTRPELIVQLFTKEWNLELPKLLLTIQGGKANFELQPKLKKVIFYFIYKCNIHSETFN